MRSKNNRFVDAEALYELEIEEEATKEHGPWRRIGRFVAYIGVAAFCYIGVVGLIAVFATVAKP